MKKTYQVNITDHALSDMEAIYSSIDESLQAPDAAVEQYNRIAASIEFYDSFQNAVHCLLLVRNVTTVCVNY